MAGNPEIRRSSSRRKTVTTEPRKHPVRPLAALGLLGLGILILLSLFSYSPNQSTEITTDAGSAPANLIGGFGVTISYNTLLLFGLGAWFLPVYLVWFGGLFLFRRGYLVSPTRSLLAFLSLAGLCGLLSILDSTFWKGFAPSFPQNYLPKDLGGWTGTIVYEGMLEHAAGALGGALLCLLIMVAGLIQTFTNFFLHLRDQLENKLRSLQDERAQRRRQKEERKSLAREDRLRLAREEKDRARQEKIARKAARGKKAPPPEPAPGLLSNLPPREEPKPAPAPKPAPLPAAPAPPPPPPAEEAPAKTSARKRDPQDEIRIVAGEKVERARNVIPPTAGDYHFPTLDLLQEPAELAPEDLDDHVEIAETLKATLAEFRVEVHLGEIHTGPVITRYEVTPAPGVRVEKIANLDKNIALALKAEGVRILAPVPGKGVVGVEVPNRKSQSVCLRDIIETRDWAETKAEIPIVLGKEVSGKPLIADLTRMPHLLIAGSTGSGKTVCINAIIASLLYRKSPADLRFIMVDPKIVEMQAYNELPHMLIPVVSEPKKVPAALKWLLSEMERRYQMFATVGVRNIAGFNARILKDKEEARKAEEIDAALTPEERVAAAGLQVPRDPNLELDLPRQKIPYIVCIVDELADLMMVAPADIETCIARLAQLARAAGIHLILATQRPSTNVITGVIKANLPTRIAFKVASITDSRVILDGKGAEALIGRGDMLFTPPGSAYMVRAQGAFVSDDEITGVVRYLVDHNEPVRYADAVQAHIETYDQEEGEDADSADSDDTGGSDEALVNQALAVLRATQRASTSMLQRRLRIGYNRAARIMEILEERGIVGPENGSNPRDILVDLNSL